MPTTKTTITLRLTIYAVTAILVTAICCGTALAGTPVADPLTTAGGSATSAIDILSTYGPVIGGTYLLFAIAQTLLARYRSASWFSRGRRLAVATGVLGVLGAALQSQIAGAPWTVVLAAAVAMAFKLLTPTVAPPPTLPTATVVNASKVSLLVLVALTLGTSQVSCTPGVRSALAAGLWNCVAPERAEAVDALTPFAESVILTAASADGKLIDTNKIKAATSTANLETETGVVLECAMATAVTTLLSQPAKAPQGTAAFAPARSGLLSPEALRDMWSQVAPSGARFQTRHGDL